MSNWTHSICWECWGKRNPDANAARMINPVLEQCCYCGADTTHGIYRRDSPQVPRFCAHRVESAEVTGL